ncbi:MAG: hypothetical protein FH749_08370 [Firmicutes bacterium]|nr:hypothetical protein [Bacillota bacterium]
MRTTLNEQAQGWQQRSVFERQWMFREFKKYSTMTTEQWLETLIRLEQEDIEGIDIPLEKLAQFYTHLQDLARGYTKDSEELEQNLATIQGWIEAVNNLNQVLTAK